LKKIGIIGSGFASLSAAACLAREGFDVHIIEKNPEIGGRARKFSADGFTFDMGPSWYWMPEVFENYFNLFGHTASDFYELIRLDPSYDVIFGKDDIVSMPANYEELKALFDSIEPGSSSNLDVFLADAEYKYNVGMREFVWKPGRSIMEYADIRVFRSLFKMHMLSSISTKVDKLFKNEKLRNILKFPVLFLGATPEKTPALYSLMNYADIKLGTWYPKGGMYRVIEAFHKIAIEQGVKFITATPVRSIGIRNGKAISLITDNETFMFDFIVSGADYHHTDQELIQNEYRNYDDIYWQRRTMAPGSLIFYLGLDMKLPGIKHHNLFFDRDLSVHADEIYNKPKWPTEPLFYLCAPSVTDPTVAPDGMENLFLLMPIAPDLNDSENLREKYFNVICDRIFSVKGIDIRKHIMHKRSYCVSDFKSDYNSFKGNAYGLANTLKQTAFLKPKLYNRKIPNLYYTGQLTTPGPGVPPSIISGQVVAREIIKNQN
jgi:phytoene desaturase